MADPLVLRIEDLRAALNRALTATEQALGNEVIIEHDHYWHLPVDVAFDMSKSPEADSLSVGQLSDDLPVVRADASHPEAAWHDLSHLIGVLRAVEQLARP